MPEQIWDLFEDKHLFTGKDAKITDDLDPNGDGYTTRAHLAEVIAMLGHPPVDLLRRGTRSRDFFTEEGTLQPQPQPHAFSPTFTHCCLGQWCADAEDVSLEESEENLEGENKKQFLDFVRSMLRWRPEDRKTAKELLNDPWLNK